MRNQKAEDGARVACVLSEESVWDACRPVHYCLFSCNVQEIRFRSIMCDQFKGPGWFCPVKVLDWGLAVDLLVHATVACDALKPRPGSFHGFG